MPRKATMSDVAERPGISSNATSARMRRGHANLIANALSREADPTEDS